MTKPPDVRGKKCCDLETDLSSRVPETYEVTDPYLKERFAENVHLFRMYQRVAYMLERGHAYV